MPFVACFPALPTRPIRSREDGLEKLRTVTGHRIDPDHYRSYRLRREAPSDPGRCQVRCVGTGVDHLMLQLRHVEPGVTGLVELDRVAGDEPKGK